MLLEGGSTLIKDKPQDVLNVYLASHELVGQPAIYVLSFLLILLNVLMNHISLAPPGICSIAVGGDMRAMKIEDNAF